MSNIPNDYNTQGGLQQPKFSAPAHQFNENQARAVVDLAESSHNDIGATSTSTTGIGSGLTESQSGSGLGSSGHGLSSQSQHAESGLTGSHFGGNAGSGALGAGAAALSGRGQSRLAVEPELSSFEA